ncbi:NADP-dependent alcohol dehydrogenase C [Paraglaciecola mesophila]|uniref:NADP-dependent alcohol dehydrogenase C n=1 Tax=Paraglaciecola mesophila TaxID=197222 RepID=A0A857JIC0_9ALTE|nr:NAD(P)-dependent alcohol dehydrogenase [Paraglaciecola mesophila]QHJ11042.1 NADP-dependent alcohol dehydrogenase C [Paraglaciecola mesophila]
MTTISAYAAKSDDGHMEPHDIKRRAPGAQDVQIDIQYCGVCHSDLHAVKNDWGNSQYPLVPGHEIIGEVSAVGSDVKNVKVGDTVGVGCMVDSCQSCAACEEHLEQHCLNGATMTYNSKVKDAAENEESITQGGYSKRIVVDEKFVLNVPKNLDKAATAPLLCAGITTYSPLHQFGVKKGMTVGVIGLGGLGHMGIKFASAMGAHVVMITTSEEKAEDAKRLGADDVLVTKDKDQMKKWRGKFDFLLNTIPVGHDVNPYLTLLKYNSTMCFVGAIEPLDAVNGAYMIGGRKALAGSFIGGIKETQEMLDFCGEHNVVADIEKIDIQDINDAFERMKNNDVRYRFVIDMQSL